MIANIQESHARLVSTKPELLQEWKDTFNTFEAFEPGTCPFGDCYRQLIDAAIETRTLDYEKTLADMTAQIRRQSQGLNSVVDIPGSDAKYREA